jgi:hypothetical protein
MKKNTRSIVVLRDRRTRPPQCGHTIFSVSDLAMGSLRFGVRILEDAKSRKIDPRRMRSHFMQR